MPLEPHALVLHHKQALEGPGTERILGDIVFIGGRLRRGVTPQRIDGEYSHVNISHINISHINIVDIVAVVVAIVVVVILVTAELSVQGNRLGGDKLEVPPGQRILNGVGAHRSCAGRARAVQMRQPVRQTATIETRSAVINISRRLQSCQVEVPELSYFRPFSHFNLLISKKLSPLFLLIFTLTSTVLRE